MQIITLYGIPNCDMVKKARAWLAAQGVAYSFYDFKKHGVPADRLAVWCEGVGWEKLLNRQGTTWRKLGADVQASACNTAGAQALMLANPSLIKRPVVQWHAGDAPITVGFDALAWLQSVKK